MIDTDRRSAQDVLRDASETELAAIFFHYGDERYAVRLARQIAIQRRSGRLPATVTEFARLANDAQNSERPSLLAQTISAIQTWWRRWVNQIVDHRR